VPPGVSSQAHADPRGLGNQRLPPQRRGRERQARIVAAAVELVNAHGPAGPEVTIRAIADGARTAPASIYHYFPDVEAVVAAVASEYMQGLLAVSGQVYAAEHPTFEGLMQQLVDVFWRYLAARPGLRELWFQRRASDEVIAIYGSYLDTATEQLHTAAGRYVDEPGQLLDYRMLLVMSGGLWQLAFKLDPAGDAKVIAEIHTNGWAFLQRRAFAATDPAPPRPDGSRKRPKRNPSRPPDSAGHTGPAANPPGRCTAKE